MATPTVNRAALPNSLTADQLRLRPDPDGNVAVDPARAGWRYLSFRSIRLAAGKAERLDSQLEHAVVPIEGGGLVVETAAHSVDVDGRRSPFDALPTACYVPAGIDATINVGDTETLVAVASAPPSGRRATAAPVAIGRADIAIEIRGAGNATRQINHIITPDFPADRLLLVEVLTPSGNWSSWPPHKHDIDDMPAEAVLEEIYYYRFRRSAGWGMQRLYRADRSRDCAWEVRGGDMVLVTDGYHPFVAAHGNDAWYLNALAGDRRTMACSFDRELDWVRDEWRSMTPDPRLPFVSR